MFLSSDHGIPDSLRNINGYSGHIRTSLRSAMDHITMSRSTSSPPPASKPLPRPKPMLLPTTPPPDILTLDLFESIASGNYSTYDVYIQTLHPSAVSSFSVKIFDITKVWPHSRAVLRPVGKIVLDTNPQNYFAEIEQAAFSPSTIVPGIKPKANFMLQARMFAYPDAQRYRLGANYQFLPHKMHRRRRFIVPTERDGFMNFKANYGGDPNYLGSSIRPVAFPGVG